MLALRLRQTKNLMKVINRYSHSTKPSSSEYHVIRTGERVLLPPNPTSSFSPQQVIAYGEKAVIFEPIENERDREREQNKHAYLRLRKYHLEYAEGKWCTVANNGNFVMFDDDPRKLYGYLNSIAARNITLDFNMGAAYTDCIGREVLVEYDMRDVFEVVTSEDDEDTVENDDVAKDSGIRTGKLSHVRYRSEQNILSVIYLELLIMLMRCYSMPPQIIQRETYVTNMINASFQLKL